MKIGNWSCAKKDKVVIDQARELTHLCLAVAARQIGVGVARLSRLADLNGITFKERYPESIDKEVEKAVREHGPFETKYTIAERLNVSYQRVQAVADKYSLELKTPRIAPDLVGLVYDENGYARKRCSRCLEMKGAEFFYEHPHHILTGLSSHCIECERAAQALARTLKRLPI